MITWVPMTRETLLRLYHPIGPGPLRIPITADQCR